MECKELVAWVPLTPQKACLETINGVNKCKDPNFIQPVDSNGGFCDGKVEKVAFSSGVKIKFGVERDVSGCTEKEVQRVTEFEDAERNLYCAEKLTELVDFPSVSTPFPGEKQNTRTRHNHNDDESRCIEKEEHSVREDEERNLHSAEKLPNNIDYPSVSTPCPAEKQDSRKRHNDGIDSNKKPKQRPKVKKHRPKIAVDRWTARKIPKAQTPRKSTPKSHKPSTIKNVNVRGKRDSGKSSNSKGFTSTSENVKGDAISETLTGLALSCKRSLKFECEAVDKCDCVEVSCNRPHQHEFHLRSVEGFSLQMSSDLNMCSDFKAQSKERGENCSSSFLYQYQCGMRGVDRSSSEANTGTNIGTEECTNSSFNTNESQSMFSNPHEIMKHSVFHLNNLHDNSKSGCLQFYRRTFRVNQCQQNSRKSGPNFPKIFKKSRTKRLKATTFLTMWSIVEGARAGGKREGAHGRCKQITRSFCAQINWKVMRKGLRSLRKSKYQRPSSVCHEFQIEEQLLKMIMPTNGQTEAAIADPESFKCVVGLSPIVKSRRKRSKGSVCQIIRHPLNASYYFEQQVVNTHEEIGGASYGSKVYEPETLQEPQVEESENHQAWRKKCSEFCNETQTLEEVQLMKNENHLDCSLNMEGFFLDNVEVHENRRLQPNESHLECTLNAPSSSSILNDVEAHGSKRLHPDVENHIGSSLSTPVLILDDVEAYGNERVQPENYLVCSLNNCLDVVEYQDENNQPRPKVVRPKAVRRKAVRRKAIRPTQECRSNYAFVKGLMDIIVKLKYLNIYDECHELVAQDPKNHGGTLVEIVPPKKQKVLPKVALDPETRRMFKLLMDNDGCEYSKDTDRDKNEWWAKEREVYRRRANSFITLMHLMQGDRRFSKWKGSVVDSIVGVFLTQNVSDVLSSSAFIHLAAKYPVKPRNKEISEDVESITSKELVGSYTRGADAQVVCNKCTDAKDGGDIEGVDCGQPCSYAFPVQDLKALVRDMDLERNNKLDTGETFNFRKSLELEELDFLQQFYGAENNLSPYNVKSDSKSSTTERSMLRSVRTAPFDLNVDPLGISRDEARSKSESNGTLGLSESQITSHQVGSNKCTDVKDDGYIEGVECEKPCSYALTVQGLQASVLDMDLKRNNKFDTSETSNFRKSLELEKLGFMQQFHGAENNLLSYNVNMELRPSTAERRMQASSTAPFDLNANPLGIPREEAQNKSESSGTLEPAGSQITSHQNVSKKSTLKHYNSGKGEKNKRTGTDWEELRKAYCNNNERGRDDDSMDAVDWEGVRNAPHEEVAQVIAVRGMQNVIAARIKDFLERVVKDHGKIDLEWLRDIPPDDVKDFLLSIDGLGLKSVECVRLLALFHRAFPVDTNVARVTVRLGWVPLAPLPEELKLHLLESYPVMDKIQMYLFPRLCTLDQETLYQLHYQLITFGKVFCTKKKPNCQACPLKGECKHYASSVASSRLALPWHKDKNIVASDMQPAVPSDQNRSMFITPLPESLFEDKISDEADPNSSEIDSTYQTINIEPIIEVPESPKPELSEPQELRDIEDYCTDDEITTIRLNEQELKKNLQDILETEYMFQEGDIADALTPLTKEAASVHPSVHPLKLQIRGRLKTVHQVFELPDFHPLLEKFEARVTDDPCPYLLAIWTTDVTSKSLQLHGNGGGSQSNEIAIHPSVRTNQTQTAIYPSVRTNQTQTIKGTILIPCRTANKGAFPLNGTYFQVNEVFADFESSKHPIDIPEAWICNLPRRSLHCGSTTTALFRDSLLGEIQYCFSEGYICLRGFDRRLRLAWPLHPRFHEKIS